MKEPIIENKTRDFKGVWITKELYKTRELSWTEKILWIEIYYLDNDNGCFASNSYFSKFLGVSKVTVSTGISKLIKLNLVEKISFDGRKRIIKALPENLNILKSCLKENLKSASKKTLNIIIKNKDTFTKVKDIKEFSHENSNSSKNSSSRTNAIKNHIQSKKNKSSKQPPSKDILYLFSQYRVVKHKIGTASYTNACEELKKKFKTHTKEEILAVFSTYETSYNDRDLRPKINNGNKLSLVNLLNNKWGKQFDWFKYFLENSYEDIKDSRLGDKILEDKHPELTFKVANAYASTFLGRDTYYLDNKKQNGQHNKFILAADKVQNVTSINEKTHVLGKEDNVIDLLMGAVEWEIEQTGWIVSPGRLCSEHCWKELLPKWIEKVLD